MELPSNYQKHVSANPLQRYLINRFMSHLAALAKQVNPQSILDAGCGEGFTLARLAKENIGRRLEGIDFSEEALALGREMNPSLNLKLGSIYKLPCADTSFDLVICSEVLEHLEHPQAALSEIARVAKKYCIFSVPNEPFFMLANFLRGKNFTRFGNDPEHIQHWTYFGFKKFLERHGFKVVRHESVFPWNLVLAEK